MAILNKNKNFRDVIKSKSNKPAHNFTDLTGQKFGHLTAIQLQPTKGPHGQTQWLLQCDCGRECIKNISNFKTKQNPHCGCQKVRRAYGLKFSNR